jgi:hypothetical protein
VSRRWMFHVAAMAAALMIISGALGGGRWAAAQEADATPDEAIELSEVTNHPAHIHSGTCENLGDVVFPLNDVQSPDLMGAPVGGPIEATPMMEGTPMPVVDQVAASTTTIETTIDDLLAEEHAINVHESAENIQNYIACGDIAGELDEEGRLIVELQELNDSGSTGQATMVDNDDGTVTVSIILTQHHGEAVGTPVATPAA